MLSRLYLKCNHFNFMRLHKPNTREQGAALFEMVLIVPFVLIYAAAVLWLGAASMDVSRQNTLAGVLVFERLAEPSGALPGSWTSLSVPAVAPNLIDDRAAKAVRIMDIFQTSAGHPKNYSIAFRYTPDGNGDSILDTRIMYDAIYPKIKGFTSTLGYTIDRSLATRNQAQVIRSAIAFRPRDSASGCFGVFRSSSSPGCS